MLFVNWPDRWHLVLATFLLTIFPRPAWCQVKQYLQCFQGSCGLHWGGASGEQNFTGTNVVFICWENLLMGSHIGGITYWWDHILFGSHIDGITYCWISFTCSWWTRSGQHKSHRKDPEPSKKKITIEKKRSYLLVLWPPVMSKVTLISPSLGRQGQLFIPNLKRKP